jgi:hypothetical protein
MLMPPICALFLPKTFQVNPPMPIYMKLYFFHILNPDAVKSGKQIPKLEERGPFTFVEYREKIKLSKPTDYGEEHIQ